ncbi:ubiquitin thiolesterase [Exophiala viscosa]|uniref:Ubiquitin thiolesterase n=1 Tax=Exophiala viscosa TaxID=2486360 RepID=A0AAN6IFN1_9EURO|nr:ubiquitin thiolesterase [Exophiala viscosa]
MSDNGSNVSRRSSSQTSHASADLKKPKTQRGAPKRHGSKASSRSIDEDDPALTSFPSFSPEPESKSSDVTVQEVVPRPIRTISQKVRERKATLAGLTSGSPTLNKQNALFDDSPRSSIDIPGSLHLAGDDHIERLIAKTGAVKLLRQYASDLAQRDAEISTLRIRADLRERELKRLLREANVSTSEVEKRLLRLEQGASGAEDQDRSSTPGRTASATSLNGMMNEAMADGMIFASSLDGTIDSTPEPQSPVNLLHSDLKGNRSRAESTASTSIQRKDSRAASRANSLLSETSQDLDATLRPRVASSSSNKVSALQNIFQQPANSSSYFIGGKPLRKQKLGDEISVRSNQSGRSFASWTQIFGGKTQAGRSRASSVGQDANNTNTASEAEASLSNLTKTRTNPPQPTTESGKMRPPARRVPTATRLTPSPNHARKESNASSIPPTVELDSMIESSQLPPTMTNQYNDKHGLLTDRFGFIYDQHRRKRQNLQLARHKRNKMSNTETIASFRAGESPGSGEPPVERPSTPASIEDESPKKSWQDYLKVPAALSSGRPRELLSHTPSASAVVTVNTADVAGTITPPHRSRETSLSAPVSAQKALPTTSVVTEPQTSAVTVTSSDFLADGEVESANESGPAKMLLDQLTDLHDALQSERGARWNDFLRRVRAERASSSDRTSNNTPEADLLDGELIGIATLGRSKQTKNKYLHFKSLVLAGIPVALRPKIWAECSGASALRNPGYYEDLVARSEEGTDIDPDIASQIKADVRRTLTDNVFFRHGPGVQRLEELLRAYSIHNPRIGYCQGMNLITASLLLICATAEDCFWLLVAIIDVILPSQYFSSTLLVARADQVVLRQYVAEILPKLSAKLEELGVELEACTFHWFLSLYTGVLTGGEALYRVWDVILCLNSSDAVPQVLSQKNLTVDMPSLNLSAPPTPTTPSMPDLNNADGEHDGTSSPFLFQLALALLKLNENAILALDSAAQVYTYINHNMTNHAISIDALIQASEALRIRVKRNEVLERRKAAIKELGA